MSTKCQYRLHRPAPIDVNCDETPPKMERGKVPRDVVNRPLAAPPGLPYEAALAAGMDRNIRMPIALVARGGLRSQRVRLPHAALSGRAASAAPAILGAANLRLATGSAAPVQLASRLGDLRIGLPVDAAAAAAAAARVRPPTAVPRDVVSRGDVRAAAAAAAAAAVARGGFGLGGLGLGPGQPAQPAAGAAAAQNARADILRVGGGGAAAQPRHGFTGRGQSAPARRGGRW